MAYASGGADQVQSGRNVNEVRQKALGMVDVELQDPAAAFVVRDEEEDVEESSREGTTVREYGSWAKS